jgi:hypothetical protein
MIYLHISVHLIICFCDISGNSASACSLFVCPQIGIPGEPGNSQDSKLTIGWAPLFSVARRTQVFTHDISELPIHFCNVQNLSSNPEFKSHVNKQNSSNSHYVYHSIVLFLLILLFWVTYFHFIVFSCHCYLFRSHFIALSYLRFVPLCSYSLCII